MWRLRLALISTGKECYTPASNLINKPRCMARARAATPFTSRLFSPKARLVANLRAEPPPEVLSQRFPQKSIKNPCCTSSVGPITPRQTYPLPVALTSIPSTTQEHRALLRLQVGFFGGQFSRVGGTKSSDWSHTHALIILFGCML